MELKKYQKSVISDLTRFLALLTEKQNIAAAYRALWTEKNVPVGLNGMAGYNDVFPGVPDICLKVPTGGGKTFLACNAIKPIFDSMPHERSQAVVWLVPSDSILEQTYRALNSPEHPYRQKIDVDFSGRVEVYSKEQLLSGQNFNPTAVTEQLSIFVLSYDSFRTSKKDGRKAYQENGNLAQFAKHQEVCPMNRGKWVGNMDFPGLSEISPALTPENILKMDDAFYRRKVQPKFFYLSPDELWKWQVDALNFMDNRYEERFQIPILDACGSRYEKVREMAETICEKRGLCAE